MRYLPLLIIFWPLVCCEQCDVTYACVAISIAVAIVLYVIASIVCALRALSAHRPQ